VELHNNTCYACLCAAGLFSVSGKGQSLDMSQETTRPITQSDRTSSTRRTRISRGLNFLDCKEGQETGND